MTGPLVWLTLCTPPRRSQKADTNRQHGWRGRAGGGDQRSAGRHLSFRVRGRRRQPGGAGSRCSHRRGDARENSGWAEDSLGLDLRVAMIPITAIRDAGFDVRVARFAASAEVTYAMFAGGGLAWSDAKMKNGDFAIPRAAPGETPDLAGLYCGFAPIKAERGIILSLIAVPNEIEPCFAKVVGDIIALLDGSGKAGRPMPDQGPLPGWTAGALKGHGRRKSADRPDKRSDGPVSGGTGKTGPWHACRSAVPQRLQTAACSKHGLPKVRRLPPDDGGLQSIGRRRDRSSIG